MLGLALLIAVVSAIGFALGIAASRLRVDGDPLTEQINATLPQTQCAQCGYPGCRPYAQAIASGEADINRCPPGGEQTVKALAELLDRPVKPVDTSHTPGHVEPGEAMLARIREPECIGCTLCIKACPVDAIVGAHKFMHTVIEAECTGCGLCVPPCPVDCIDMVPEPNPARPYPKPEPA